MDQKQRYKFSMLKKEYDRLLSKVNLKIFNEHFSIDDRKYLEGKVNEIDKNYKRLLTNGDVENLEEFLLSLKHELKELESKINVLSKEFTADDLQNMFK